MHPKKQERREKYSEVVAFESCAVQRGAGAWASLPSNNLIVTFPLFYESRIGPTPLCYRSDIHLPLLSPMVLEQCRLSRHVVFIKKTLCLSLQFRDSANLVCLFTVSSGEVV